MRIHAYILAADPTWIRTSVLSYYGLIDRLYVSFDERSIGWTGSPIDVTTCLNAVRALDEAGKVVLCPGDFSRPDSPLHGETRQRQAALDLAGVDADWVLQMDTDEVLPRTQPLLNILEVASARDIPAVEWPMRVLYRRLDRSRYLQVVTAAGALHVEYPGPIAVRPGTRLVDARRTNEAFLRPVPAQVGGLQIERAPEPREERLIDSLKAEDVIIHNSWARSPAAVRAKVSSWGHNQGWRSHLYYALKWLPARYVGTTLRDFHPFARDLWPRLGLFDMHTPPIHPAEESQ